MTTDFKLMVADSVESWQWRHKIKLVWTDPPFGTNKKQQRAFGSWTDTNAVNATRIVVEAIAKIRPHLTEDAVVCICADYRIIHDVVSVMKWDFHHQGDIIWTFGLGRPRTSWWPVRHNTISTFTLTPELPTFDQSAVPREIRKAPKEGYEGDKAAGSVWDFTMSNTHPDRVGYPNQKPIEIIEPFIRAHTLPGDVVADPFMGSGSTGVAALRCGRKFLGQDTNLEALKIARERLRNVR